MTAPTDLPVHRFADQTAFEAWLEAEHERSPGIYVVIAKKGAPEPTLKQAEMVESLLCFGWIDGRANRLDDHHFTTRVTPRRPKSVWSKKNVEWVARLVEAGRMRPAGLAAVEAAKADGRWASAYRMKASEAPPDLLAAIRADPRARAMYEKLSSQNRFALTFRTLAMKTAAGRAKKIATFVAMLRRGETIHPQKDRG